MSRSKKLPPMFGPAADHKDAEWLTFEVGDYSVGKRLYFRYVDMVGQASQREVMVSGLFFRDAGASILGKCRLVNAYRGFRVDRITYVAGILDQDVSRALIELLKSKGEMITEEDIASRERFTVSISYSDE